MSQIGRRFALSAESETGVCCGENGASVGAVPLLERFCGAGPGGHDQWRPRPLPDLNRDLSGRYGLPVEFDQKIDGLKAVARALSRGDLIHAQISTLHLEIPDPPTLTKSARTLDAVLDLARQLRSSGMLKADWDPAKHPRWPAGSPDSIGGQFAPTDAASDDAVVAEQSSDRGSAVESNGPLIPVELTIPVPFDLPGEIPLPSEILPPPAAIPDINPRSNFRNPFPDRPECEEEWGHALEYCRRLLENKRMGSDGYRGFGKTFQQCVLGMVREDCGGSLKS